MFSSTPEVLIMLTLSTEHLLKVHLPFSFQKLKNSKNSFFFLWGTPNIFLLARYVLIDWNHQKISFFSKLLPVHAMHIPSTVSGSGGQIAPDAKMTGPSTNCECTWHTIHTKRPV